MQLPPASITFRVRWLRAWRGLGVLVIDQFLVVLALSWPGNGATRVQFRVAEQQRCTPTAFYVRSVMNMAVHADMCAASLCTQKCACALQVLVERFSSDLGNYSVISGMQERLLQIQSR